MKADRRRKVTPETVKRMRELRSQGMTYQNIAKKLNLSYLTVYKYLNPEKEVKGEVETQKEEASPEKKPGFWARLKAKLGA
jgi:DNA invertase Pin-like site-specific DNA recombinase